MYYLMKNSMLPVIESVDQIISKLYLTLFPEKNSLIVYLFHALLHDHEESNLNVIDPSQGITVQLFRQFIEYHLKHSYTFISPDDILNGLNNDKRYILMTFDDGYFNNENALPILKEYKIPAVFSISANNVKYNKCFWWDVLYRERKKRGTKTITILREDKKLKLRTSESIEKYLTDLFGTKALEPIGDLDRPFTPSELRNFSREKYVFLGNHTKDHAILTNYSSEGIKSQILDAQNTIYKITGIVPIIISYPNGNYSNEIIRISKEVGLKLGITVDFKKNYLPIDFQHNGFMRLGRFAIPDNNEVIKQCRMFRSDIVLTSAIWNLINRRH